MSYYITGDAHGDFRHINYKHFKNNYFQKDDVLIILGDSGFNADVLKRMCWEINDDTVIYTCSKNNMNNKENFISIIPSTVLCIHGNHEARPETIQGYVKKKWKGGEVFYQPEFPTLLFAVDGEVYMFNNQKYLVIGGAYSVDKSVRIKRYIAGESYMKWFSDEQPSEYSKKKVEEMLEKNNWIIHGILSHTCPYKYIPREFFLPDIDQSKIDISTEQWLDTIENRTCYDIWYHGHFHGNKKTKKIQMLFHDIKKLE
ncbi:metallophosphoesterase [Faecalicoccus pleomorphus]|uniref:metallophosphoesterase n=1 Tax=Faecalicoccus pleomorphus TaxID=1323 RepID=UPI0039F60571